MTTYPQWFTHSAFDAAPAHGAVRITPNRQRLEAKFPVLGFTADAGGHPYFEVLLATDRSLFHPSNAARRSSSTFYASRQDSGLIRAEAEPSVFIVPSAAVHALSGASEIYYTAAAYDAPDGANPILAMPVEELVRNAPSVTVAPDMRSAPLNKVLSVPVSRLLRVRDDDDGTASSYAAFAAMTRPADPNDDRGEGEDGYGLAAEALEMPVTAQALEDDGAEEPVYAAGYEDDDDAADRAAAAFAHDVDDSSGSWGPDNAAPEAAASAAGDYDDGFDGPISSASASDTGDAGDGDEAYAQESTYPTGAQTPQMLEDDEDGPVSAQSFEDEGGYDEQLGFESLQTPTTQSVQLDIAAKRRIIDIIAPYESSSDRYAAINADGEFEGRFDRADHPHPASHRFHIGLSYGFIQFTQDSGALGQLLTLMRQRDQQAFDRIFGSDAQALLTITNAHGASSAESQGGRSARVQPVGGADLWREPWLARFRQAAAHPPFQAAQNELASRLFLDPMLQFAGWLGLNTDRALAVVVDRAIQMGLGGARQWIIEAAGAVQTPAQRQQALTALGHADLRAFQTATHGLSADGRWGASTHAAMTGALRALGSRSPLPVMTRDQMLDALVRRASTTPWATRTRELRQSRSFSDTEYSI